MSANIRELKAEAKRQIIKLAKDRLGDKFSETAIGRGLVRALNDADSLEMGGTQLASQYLTKVAVLKATGQGVSKKEVKEELSYSLFVYMIQNRRKLTKEKVANKIQWIKIKKVRAFIYQLVDLLQENID